VGGTSAAISVSASPRWTVRISQPQRRRSCSVSCSSAMIRSTR
jgi:hypothetical protein